MVTPTRLNIVLYLHCSSSDFVTAYAIGSTQWVFPLLFSGVQRSTLCPKRRVLIRIPNTTRWAKFKEPMVPEVIYRGQSNKTLLRTSYTCCNAAFTGYVRTVLQPGPTTAKNSLSYSIILVTYECTSKKDHFVTFNDSTVRHHECFVGHTNCSSHQSNRRNINRSNTKLQQITKAFVVGNVKYSYLQQHPHGWTICLTTLSEKLPGDHGAEKHCFSSRSQTYELLRFGRQMNLLYFCNTQ
jgi:hypothetical protein